ncbi:hypothetical protein KF134_1244 [Lactococcus lactis subsp. lactis]|uniref:phosphoribosyltransferase n=1 Tax=Lactococcus lactis TaxID=1358 RepID=UPI00071CF3D7|nr:phosphoribosyltransferase [Lactococcus lactis]KST91470.1 hypothetical protein KF134_1244 [Lactococcus lactis subsp. lactis]
MSNPIYVFEDGTPLKNKKKIYSWILEKNRNSKIIDTEKLCKKFGASFFENIDRDYILVAIGQGGKMVLNYLKKYHYVSNEVYEISCERKFENEEMIGYQIDNEQLNLLPVNSTVILFEDAIDSGGTINFVTNEILKRNSKVVRICSIFNISTFKSEKLKVLYQSELFDTNNLFSTRHLIFGEKGKNFHSKMFDNFFDNDIKFEQLLHEELENVN